MPFKSMSNVAQYLRFIRMSQFSFLLGAGGAQSRATEIQLDFSAIWISDESDGRRRAMLYVISLWRSVYALCCMVCLCMCVRECALTICAHVFVSDLNDSISFLFLAWFHNNRREHRQSIIHWILSLLFSRIVSRRKSCGMCGSVVGERRQAIGENRYGTHIHSPARLLVRALSAHGWDLGSMRASNRRIYVCGMPFYYNNWVWTNGTPSKLASIEWQEQTSMRKTCARCGSRRIYIFATFIETYFDAMGNEGTESEGGEYYQSTSFIETRIMMILISVCAWRPQHEQSAPKLLLFKHRNPSTNFN